MYFFWCFFCDEIFWIFFESYLFWIGVGYVFFVLFVIMIVVFVIIEEMYFLIRWLN